MMRLYFLRHGQAGTRDEWTGPDEDRPLTRRGISETQAAAHGMRWLDLDVDLLLSSPLVRAYQTAEITAGILKCEVVRAPALAPGCTLVALAELLATHIPLDHSATEPTETSNHSTIPRGVLLVGHEPDFSSLSGTLIGRKGGASILLKKGALCRIDLAPEMNGWRWDASHLRASGTLVWLLTVKQLGHLGR